MPRFSGRKGLLMVFGVLIGVGGLSLLGQQAQQPISPQPLPKVKADAELREVHLVETREGQKLWEVKADRVQAFEKEAKVQAREVTRPVEVILYTDQGVVHASAGTVLLNLRTKDLTLEGNVKAASEQGTHLLTDSLSWSAERRRFFSDQEVVVVRGGLVNRGRGLEGEGGLERVRILRHVESRVDLRERR